MTKLKKVMTLWDGPHICTAGSHFVTPSGTCKLCITINGTTYPAALVILLNRSCDVILGMDFLMDSGATIHLLAVSFPADYTKAKH